jgi:hypothetical protein
MHGKVSTVNRPKPHPLFTTGDLAATCGEIQERFDPRPPIVLVTQVMPPGGCKWSASV